MDQQDGKTKRRSPVTKNEHARQRLQQAVVNQMPFNSGLHAVGVASAENMVFLKPDLQKDFVLPLKVKRKVALSLDDKRQGKYVRVDRLGFADHTPQQVYRKACPSHSCWSSKSSQTMTVARGCGIWSPATPR